MDNSNPFAQSSTSNQPQVIATPVLPPQLSAPQDAAWRHLLYNTQLKLQESNQRLAPSSLPIMSSNSGHRGSSSGQGQEYKGSSGQSRGGSYSSGRGVLDGLLPRIETRGQSRGGYGAYSTKDDKQTSGRGSGSYR